MPSNLNWNSKVLTNQHQERLEKMFPSALKANKLLYRASENDFDAVKFFEKCSNIANTVVVAQTQYGKVIGGYTPLEWKVYQQQSYDDKGGAVEDVIGTSFLFSLTQNDKFDLYYDGPGIQNSDGSKFGPCFGNNDLCIWTGQNQSCSWINMTYYNQKYKKQDDQSCERFNGNPSQYFGVKEWEVFEVQF